MTKLEAVNQVLRGVGRAGTAALDTDGNSEAAQAERVLDEVDLEVQSRGWYYNTRRDVTLTPAGDDTIALPTGAITIDAYGTDARRHVTQLGGSLYDLDNHTDEFTGNLQVEYVLRYDFGCIPQPVQHYIACAAAVAYNERYGHPSRARGLLMAEQRAMGHAKVFDNNSQDTNVLSSQDAEMVRGSRFRVTP